MSRQFVGRRCRNEGKSRLHPPVPPIPPVYNISRIYARAVQVSLTLQDSSYGLDTVIVSVED